MEFYGVSSCDIFRSFEFDNIYIENGDLGLREKIAKFKGIFIILTSLYHRILYITFISISKLIKMAKQQ
ncbi:hypothetical protein CHH52_01280 [Shouchella clausii]|nr:hypothetical protein CHH52_01280 [Shouchella clausii]